MIYNSQKDPAYQKGEGTPPEEGERTQSFLLEGVFVSFIFKQPIPPSPPTTPSSDLIRIVTRSYFKGEGGISTLPPQNSFVFILFWMILPTCEFLTFFFHYDFCHSSYSFPWFFLHFLFFIVFFFFLHAYLKSLKYASAPVWLSNDLLRVSYFVCHLSITDFDS